MKNYVKPTYKMEGIETEDVILASIMVRDAGTATMENITGEAGIFEVDYSNIFGVR